MTARPGPLVLPRLSRRRFLALTAGAAAGLALNGCRSDRTVGAGRLRVLSWPEYIDVTDGATPGTVDRFTAATGIEVDYTEGYEGNAEAFATHFQPTLGAGKAAAFDIAVPTYWAVARMLEQGWLEEIPLEHVPNHVHIEPAYLGMPWDRGARFHMPWQVGITGIAYDPKRTNREIRSVADLLAPDLRGRVGMISEMRETVGLLMLAAGDDPSRATSVAANAALDRLEALQRQQHVKAFTANEFVDELKSGSFAACFAWSGDVVQLQAERPDIRFVIPAEGGIRWFDSMVILKGSPNVVEAARWMDFAYAPAEAAQITTGVQYISPVLGVREVLAQQGDDGRALAENTILFPDDQTRRRLFFWAGLDPDEEDQLQARFDGIIGA